MVTRLALWDNYSIFLHTAGGFYDSVYGGAEYSEYCGYYWSSGHNRFLFERCLLGAALPTMASLFGPSVHRRVSGHRHIAPQPEDCYESGLWRQCQGAQQQNEDRLQSLHRRPQVRRCGVCIILNTHRPPTWSLFSTTSTLMVYILIKFNMLRVV